MEGNNLMVSVAEDLQRHGFKKGRSGRFGQTEIPPVDQSNNWRTNNPMCPPTPTRSGKGKHVAQKMVAPLEILKNLKGRGNFADWCREQWGMSIQVNTLPNNYYLIEVMEEVDQWKALNNGPYMLDGTRVNLINWCPNFNPMTHTLAGSPTLVRLYNIPPKYCNIEMLKEITKSLGTFISIDDILEDRIWGSFARICVNVSQISTMPTCIKIHGEGEV
ncbi:hypothetical protein SUGI_0389820 [Cryptomeria japonica]|nr:hypothetical protein SUGI_0389820 [Cryptomeria japonica]